MTLDFLLFILLLFQVKHVLGDWVWQTGWMVNNKGIWGHPGGIVHAGLHGLLSLPVLYIAGLELLAVVIVAAVEAVVHYHLDWIKGRHTRLKAQSPSDKAFWVWMGIDQFAHQVTYIAILLYLVRVL